MKCTQCGSEVAAGKNFCTVCGAAAPQPPIAVTVLLSQEDARQGCRKALRLEGMAQPVMLQLPGNLSDGQQLRVPKVRVNSQERDVLLTLRIQSPTPAKPKKKHSGKWIWPVLIVAMLVLAAAFLYRPVMDLLHPQPEPTLSSQQIREEAALLIPYFEQRYLLQQLQDEELSLFCQLYRGAKESRETISVSGDLPSQTLELLMHLLEVECPELFHVDFSQGTSFTVNLETDQVQTVTLSYRMNAARYETLHKQCSDAVSRLAKEAKGMDPEEALKFVFDYLCLNCYYDKETDLCATACGALVEGRAKCDGLSLACKWLLEEMGMESICVVADIPGSPVGHAWNKVCIDGTYYNVDVTQSVRQDSLPLPLTEQVIYVAYMVSDEYMEPFYDVVDFYETLGGLPECHTMTESHYARQDTLISDEDDPDAVLHQALNNALAQGELFAVIQFENTKDCQFFLNRADAVLREYLNTQPQSMFITYWTFCQTTLVFYFGE